MALESKDLVGLLLLLVGSVVLTAAMLFWPRLRAPAFFLIAAGIVTSRWFDLSIYSAYWYRGTTRGFEVTIFDTLAIGLLCSTLLSPRPGDTPPRFWPASLGMMLVFLLYCAGSTLVAEPFIFGLYELSQIVRAILYFLAAAMFVRRERDVSVLVAGLALAVGFEAAMAFRERLLLGMYRPGGSLEHPNSLSMYLCLTTPVLIAAACSTLGPWIRRLCWAAAIAAAGTMVLTLSRAGLPVFLVTSGGALLWCASWRPSPSRLAVGVIVLAGLSALVMKSWPLLAARFGQSTLQEEYFDAQGESRGYYFRQADVILEHKPFGVGLNNWSYWVSREYGRPLGMIYQNYDDIVYAPPSDLLPMYRYAAPAHNLGVLTVAEIGWIGLALMLVLWLRWLTMGAGFLFSRRPEPLHRVGIGIWFGLLAVFLHSFTEWTFRQSQIFLMFHLLVGVFASFIALKRIEAANAREEIGEEAIDDWSGAPAAEPATMSPLRS
jgi:hypothetical protein